MAQYSQKYSISRLVSFACVAVLLCYLSESTTYFSPLKLGKPIAFIHAHSPAARAHGLSQGFRTRLPPRGDWGTFQGPEQPIQTFPRDVPTTSTTPAQLSSFEPGSVVDAFRVGSGAAPAAYAQPPADLMNLSNQSFPPMMHQASHAMPDAPPVPQRKLSQFWNQSPIIVLDFNNRSTSTLQSMDQTLQPISSQRAALAQHH